jgi:hypothetical protein
MRQVKSTSLMVISETGFNLDNTIIYSTRLVPFFLN